MGFNVMKQGDGRRLRNQQNQCPTCGLYFKSNAAFDKHRTGRIDNGTRRCMTEVEMHAAGMGINAGGWWVTEKMPDRMLAKFDQP